MKSFFIKILFFVLLLNPLVAQKLDKVTLQLKWTHVFQFAGYYAAVEQGFYKDAGLDVTILEASPGTDPVEKVLNGDAQFGVGTSSLLLSRQAGKPVKVLSVIFQHSPLVLITNPLTAKEGLDNISTKRIMIEPHADEILAYLKKQNTPLKKLNLLEHSFNPKDLIENRVDAISAYVTNETWFLDKAGFNYNVFTPRSVGIDFYGDNLFTSERLLADNAQLVEKFRDASLKGWKYAMSNIDEIAHLIHSKYSDKLPLEFYTYEAHRMEELMQPELIEIGYMNTNRWKHIADTYIDLGLLPKDFNFKDLIYNRDYKTELSRSQTLTVIIIVLFILMIFVILYIYRINIKLKNSKDNFRTLTISLEKQNETLQQQTNILSKQAQMIRQIHDSIVSTDMEGNIATWNHGSEVLFGYKEDEAIGKHISILHVEGNLPEHNKRIEILKQTGEYTEEIALLTKSKAIVWVSLSLSLLRDENQKPIQMIGYAKDITKRYELDKELKSSYSMLEKLTQNVPGAIFQYRLHPDGHLSVPFISNGIEDLYEITQKDAMEGSYVEFDVIHPDDLDMLTTSMKDSAQSMNDWKLQYRVSLPKKGVRWLEGLAKPEKLEDGSVLWHGYVHDITEVKRKDELMISQSLNAAKGEMVGMIAHQWRQPLSVISMYINNILLDIELGTFNENETKESTNKVLEQIQYLSNTIEDFRNFFKPDKELSKVKIPNLLEQTYSIIQDSLINNNIELKKSYESESEVNAYPRELMQVFVNIVHNAKDILVLNNIDDAFIEINVYENEDYIMTDICDNGGGIDENILPKIFDPYFSTKDEKNGTGIGLYMSKMIIENHLHGTIEAFNTQNGACIRVKLKKT